MSISIYWQVFKYFSLRMLYYPFSILMDVLLRVESIVFLIFFWGLVSSSLHQSISMIIAYFFISRFVNEISMATYMSIANLVKKHVKGGTFSQYIIKPVNIIQYMYFELLGERGVIIFLNSIFFVVGIILIGHINLVSFFLFIINLILAIFTSLAFNTLLSAYFVAITFHGDFKNVFNHVNRLLSGALVPLSFFPDGIKQILLFLPFQNMIFGPANALSTFEINNTVIIQTLVSIAWTVVLFFLSKYLWKKALIKYESDGI